MKQLKDIKRKLEWEQYYNPDFNWYDWRFYSNNNLSEEFIKEFQNKVEWDYISIYQNLSEDFIRNEKPFISPMNWTYISEYQKLSENFIREFKNNVNWEYISKYQTLSEDFKKELFQYYNEEFKKNCVLYETF